MQGVGLAKIAVCPLWGLATWNPKKRGEVTDGIYGDIVNTAQEAQWSVSFTIALVVGLLFWFVLWMWPLLKAFTCGNSPTSLGGTGLLWGLLIFVFPPLGILYLFAGRCKEDAHNLNFREPLPSETGEY